MERLETRVGGPARARVVAVLACVLALDSADQATLGATATQVESQLHVSNTELGALAAISALVAAVSTVPIGALTDRVRRVNLLAGSIVLWGAAMVAGAVAPDYTWLLLSRVALGSVSATSGPTVASLTGDFFPVKERAKIYGYVLSGELLGGGFGFLVTGSLAAFLSWRGAYAFLAIPGLLLAWSILRHLPEPARGGQSRLHRGARTILDADDLGDGDARKGQESSMPGQGRDGAITEAILNRDGVEPRGELVLRRDPIRMRLASAVRYVLRVPTNRWLILASIVGYFFFAGLRTFGMVFVRGQFGLGQAGATALLFVAGMGAVAGVLVAGRTADRLLRRGRMTARIVVGGTAYVLAAALLLPAVLVASVGVAAPLLLLAGAMLAAPNPPLDAARLDVMPARLWGRAEGVRSLLRQSAQAGAPLLFGLTADILGGGHGLRSDSAVTPAMTHGLQHAFLLMLLPLAVSGLIVLWARRGYPRDVATAVTSEEAIGKDVSGGRAGAPYPREGGRAWDPKLHP